MSLGNPLWGAPRIHRELLELGIDVFQATVAGGPVVPNPVARLNGGFQRYFAGWRRAALIR